MKAKYHITLFTTIFLFVFGCSTGPDFERDNENDPGGKTFVPNPPNGENYYFENNGNIVLTWSDNTKYEDAYLVYKSLSSDENFTKIAELDSNTTSFVDSSGFFAFPTIYKVVAFAEPNESSSLVIPINFGGLNSFNYTIENDKIDLSWESNIVLHHGFLLTRITNNENIVKVVKTIPPAETSSSVDIPQDGFYQKFMLAPFRVLDSDTTTLPSLSVTTTTTMPSNLKISPISLDSIQISWTDNSNFEDSFELSIQHPDGASNISLPADQNSYFFVRNMQIGDQITARLQAKHGKELSITLEQSFITSSILAPVIDSATTVSPNELILHIHEPSGIRRSAEVFRSINGGSFTYLGVIPKGEQTFRDTDVEKNNYYTFKLNTDISGESDEVDFFYFPKPELTDSLPGPSRWIHNFAYSTNYETLIFASGIDETQADKIILYNFSSGSISQINAPDEHIEHIRASESGNRFAVYDWRGNSDKLFLYDTNQRTLTQTITIPNLDYARDFVFLNNDQLLISAQMNNQPSHEYNQQLLRYTISTSAVETLALLDLHRINLNYEENFFYLYKSRRSSAENPFSVNINKYSIDNSGLHLLESKGFQTNQNLEEYRLRINTSPKGDTILVSTGINGEGFIKYKFETNQILNSVAMHGTSYASYYSPLTTFISKRGGIAVINHYDGSIQSVLESHFEPHYQSSFPGDFIYIRPLNLLIDAQSNYGTDVYLESNLRIFKLKPGWWKK